uniref:Uncharacterized protein n=1 Tax=viral metagenome TaxID=1070528 RepID=A0A6M3LS46_9ZZZZ
MQGQNDYIEELRQKIQGMTRRTELFKVLKEELTKQGYWRNRARGKKEDIKE